MATLENFIYFENSKTGINFDEVSDFCIGKTVEHPMALDPESYGKTMETLVFHMKNSRKVIISSPNDIANFEQNYL